MNDLFLAPLEINFPKSFAKGKTLKMQVLKRHGVNTKNDWNYETYNVEIENGELVKAEIESKWYYVRLDSAKTHWSNGFNLCKALGLATSEINPQDEGDEDLQMMGQTMH